MSDSLKHLCQLADERKAAKHPTLPAHARVKAKYSDKSANELTRCIVDYLTLSGHFATRLQSTGTYRADLQRFVPSQQRAGLPDIYSCVDGGHAVHIEIKVGKDRLSEDQKQTISDLQQAGASVFITGDFQTFYDWFTTEFLTPPFP